VRRLGSRSLAGPKLPRPGAVLHQPRVLQRVEGDAVPHAPDLRRREGDGQHQVALRWDRERDCAAAARPRLVRSPEAYAKWPLRAPLGPVNGARARPRGWRGVALRLKRRGAGRCSATEETGAGRARTGRRGGGGSP